MDREHSSSLLETYRSFFRLNKDLDIIPDLAESWEVSNDGMVYTFNLRDDIKFSNGEDHKKGQNKTVKNIFKTIKIKIFL